MEGLMNNLSGAGFNTDQLSLELNSNNNASSVFPVFVSKMCQEICLLLSTEETVHVLAANDDGGHSWKMELSSLLKELGCPYVANLVAPDLNDRFETKAHRMVLLHYLLTTLMAARMSQPEDKTNGGSAAVQSGTTAQLELALTALNIGKPPPNVTPAQLFSQVCSVIEKINTNYRKVRRIEMLPLFCLHWHGSMIR